VFLKKLLKICVQGQAYADFGSMGRRQDFLRQPPGQGEVRIFRLNFFTK
jgi:hypothetical protein